MIGDPVMLKVAGKRFRCSCGANVLTQTAEEEYRCNGCGATYSSAPHNVESQPAHSPAEVANALRVARQALSEGWLPAYAADALRVLVDAADPGEQFDTTGNRTGYGG